LTYYRPLNFAPVGEQPPEPAAARSSPVAINISDRGVSVDTGEDEGRKELVALTAQLAALVSADRERPIVVESPPAPPAAPSRTRTINKIVKRNSKGQITSVIETVMD